MTASNARFAMEISLVQVLTCVPELQPEKIYPYHSLSICLSVEICWSAYIPPYPITRTDSTIYTGQLLYWHYAHRNTIQCLLIQYFEVFTVHKFINS